jgi:hypothetical protein
METEHFLSIYAHVCPVASAYRISRRHDQAMALWRRRGHDLSLVRYWEFERLTGIKGHGLSFPDADAAMAFIADALAEEGLTPGDLSAIIGTPGLTAPGQSAPVERTDSSAVTYHGLCHIRTGLLIDTEVFRTGRILCLSLDAGPDTVGDPRVWEQQHYVGAFADRGRVTLFPVSSPALLWALMRERCGLEEGTLMALGSASRCAVPFDPTPAPEILSIRDRFAAADWLEGLQARLDALAARNPDAFTCPDGWFDEAQTRMAVLVKIVQQASFDMVAATVQQALDRFDADPAEVHLSMVGGFALNCPTNGRLMKRFRFKGFLAPPTVNDSGMALGIGLDHAIAQDNAVNFRLGTAFHGRRHDWAAPAGSSFDPDQVAADILEGPIVWFDGAAEIGPRALGHRSILADPRRPDHKDVLNRIKQRQWWRPVAPLVRAAEAAAWFDLTGESPFMLQAVTVHPHRRELIPAICHLDGTARVQTLAPKDDPGLDAVLEAFARLTGVPMLCNTSLNDKGEPIIDCPERALAFAREKGIATVYINGTRLRPLDTDDVSDGHCPGIAGADACARPAARHFAVPQMDEAWIERHNPHGLTRQELIAHAADPRMAGLDPLRMQDVVLIRRVLSMARRRHGATADLMLAQIGVNTESSGALEIGTD